MRLAFGSDHSLIRAYHLLENWHAESIPQNVAIVVRQPLLQFGENGQRLLELNALLGQITQHWHARRYRRWPE